MTLYNFATACGVQHDIGYIPVKCQSCEILLGGCCLLLPVKRDFIYSGMCSMGSSGNMQQLGVVLQLCVFTYIASQHPGQDASLSDGTTSYSTANDRYQWLRHFTSCV